MLRYAAITAAAAALLNLSGCITWVPGDKEYVMQTAPQETGFINKELEDGYRYTVYVPRDYAPGKAWPLIVFLHGAGERGDNGLAQSSVGLGRAIRFHPERFPAVVLMPQCPKDVFWNSIWDTLQETLDRTVAEYNVDRDRVYLTGLSMGGYGTWLWGGIEPERFAALMPICGGGEIPKRLAEADAPHPFGTLEERVPRLATLPIWAFHGEDDTTVPPERSRDMVERVRAAGGDIRLTEFPDTGHNSWDKAYGMEKAIEWMFQQKR